MVSERVRRNIPALRALYKSKGQSRKRVLKNVSNDTIDAISDCACNIRNGNLPISPVLKRALKPYHSHIKALSRKGTSYKKRREHLQTGGFLGLLLKPLISAVIGPLLGK